MPIPSQTSLLSRRCNRDECLQEEDSLCPVRAFNRRQRTECLQGEGIAIASGLAWGQKATP